MPKIGLTFVDDAAPFLEALNLNKIAGALEDANTFYPAGGTANAITITTANGNYSYEPNIKLQFKATQDATAAMTANVDSNGPLPLKNEDGTDFDSAETGKFYTFVLNDAATAFLNAPSGGASSFGAYVKFLGLNNIYNVSGGAIQNWGDASVPSRGQTFVTPLSGSLNLFKISTYLDKLGTPTDSVVLKIYNTSGGLPTGAAIATSDNVVLGSSIIAGTYEFNFSGVTLLSNTTYAYTLERTGPIDSTNRYRSAAQTSSVYPNGTALYQDGTFTWISIPTQDLNGLVQLGEPQATLQTDGEDAEVKTGQYIMANHAVFIDDGGSGQTIPSVDDATSESQLQATVDGILKTDTSYSTERQVIASVFNESQGFTTL